MFAYHDSYSRYYTDYIGLVSEDGFKNTGLNNGENHLKCWFQGGESSNLYGSQHYDDEWTPDFEADDG